MPPTNLRNTNTLLFTHLTPGTTATTTIPINMARNATPAPISSTSTPPSKPTTRRRPTALQSSLLAQIGPRKTYITTGKGNPRPPTNIEAELADREREKAEAAAKVDAAAAKLEKEKAGREKANTEKRNRVDDADNEVAKFDFNDFDVSADSNSKMDMDMNISFASTDTDGSVIHHDEDGEKHDGYATLCTQILVEENQGLVKRVEALEAETSSLLHTRALEHDRLKSINAALVSKLAHSRACTASASAEAKVWEGQMMDRDGEVQRLRALLAELQDELDDRRGSWDVGGSQAVS